MKMTTAAKSVTFVLLVLLSGPVILLGQEEPVAATQSSRALMDGCRPISLVFCHAHSAQIPEDSCWPSPHASGERFRGE